MDFNNNQSGFNSGMNFQNGSFQQPQNSGFGPMPQTNGAFIPQPTNRPYGSFMDRPSYQNMQSMPQFVGKFISNPNEITLNDIPMDGRPAIFPAKDWSAIVVKTWKATGEILTVVYTVDPNQFQEQTQQNELDDIRTRLENLESSLKAQRTRTNAKAKEDVTNG